MANTNLSCTQFTNDQKEKTKLWINAIMNWNGNYSFLIAFLNYNSEMAFGNEHKIKENEKTNSGAMLLRRVKLQKAFSEILKFILCHSLDRKSF